MPKIMYHPTLTFLRMKTPVTISVDSPRARKKKEQIGTRKKR